MHVERFYMDNPLRNYSYFLICENTCQALLVDPFDGERCLALAKQLQIDIQAIVNTHEHWDHIQGNAAVVDKTGATVYAHPNAIAALDTPATPLTHNEILTIGNSIQCKALDTPGHTLAHICLITTDDTPKLFCGDTLFSAGVGNCHNGGDPKILYQTVSQILSKLPNQTQLHTGHDYLENNLQFALSREPNNTATKTLLKQTQQESPLTRHVTTLAEEKEINPFFRLDNTSIIDVLRSELPNLNTTPESIFLNLRRYRDQW